MRSQQYRNLTALILAIYLLSHFFTTYAISHCGQKQTIEGMIIARQEALRLAQEKLDNLNDEGYIGEIREKGKYVAIGSAIGGGIFGFILPGPGIVGGIVFGYMAGGITGTVVAIGSHYNKVKDAEAEVKARQGDLDQAMQWLYECENGTLCGTCWNQGGACNACDR
ncbi:MAG: hypothetical protein OXM61_17025 [Candidatus Poribacteria bacterium]|nr:hypothetical protein [Candidatus Poribacteria bacterium]